MKTTNKQGQELWVVIDKNFEPLRWKAPFNRFGNGIIYYTRGQALKKQGFGMGKAVSVKKLLSWVQELKGHFEIEEMMLKGLGGRVKCGGLLTFDKRTADGTGMND